MGAVTFSLDASFVKAFKSVLPLNIFVETGTFKGDTINELAPQFEKLFSIELSDLLWQEAIKRFDKNPNVTIILGSSDVKLRELRPELIDASVIYWLDAHWCVASDTAGQQSQCPLLGELRAINSLNDKSVILIDDARLFLAPPLAPHEISQWPSLHEIVMALISLSSKHQLMIVNDVIAFFPPSAKDQVIAYAQHHGFDWLVAADCMKQNNTFIVQLTDKEAVIQEKEAALQEKEAAIQELHRALSRIYLAIKEKDELIDNNNTELFQQRTRLQEMEHIIYLQADAIIAYRRFYGHLPFYKKINDIIHRTISRTNEIFRPRLGYLNQYTPRPITSVGKEKSTHCTSYPVISIVTPSFNQGVFIEETLLSVLQQQYPNLEYFVQDGSSTDNTIDILAKYADQLSGWSSEKDTGQSQAINRGFAQTSGEIMAWLNSDDLLLPGCLNAILKFFNSHPDIDVVYGNRLIIDDNSMEIGRWIMPRHDNKILSWVDYVPQESLFWRRSIWDKSGGMIDESFKFAMDWDLLIRFRDAGARFARIPRFLGAFRIHEQQKTSSLINDLGRQEMDRIRLRLLGHVPSDQEILKAAQSYLIKHLAVDMAYRINTRLQGFLTVQ